MLTVLIKTVPKFLLSLCLKNQDVVCAHVAVVKDWQEFCFAHKIVKSALIGIICDLFYNIFVLIFFVGNPFSAHQASLNGIPSVDKYKY